MLPLQNENSNLTNDDAFVAPPSNSVMSDIASSSPSSAPQYRLATLASVAISSAVVTGCALTYLQRRAARLAIQCGDATTGHGYTENQAVTTQSNPLWESPDEKRAAIASVARSSTAASTAAAMATRIVTTVPRARPDPYDSSARTDYLSWDDYFMAVAFLSSQRSKDPSKQVGAVIVDQQNVICGIGYNGFPRGCPDSKLPWSKLSRSGSKLDTKYPYVCHAEMNAILNKNNSNVAGSKVYVTMFPCNECAKLMIQAGIAEIVFHEDKVQSEPKAETPGASNFKLADQYSASKKLLALAGVKIRQHQFRRVISLALTNDGIVEADVGGELSALLSSKRQRVTTRFDD